MPDNVSKNHLLTLDWLAETDDSQNFRDSTLCWHTGKTEYGFHFKQEPHMSQQLSVAPENAETPTALFIHFLSLDPFS